MKVSEIMSGGRVISPGRPDHKPKITIVTPTYKRNAEGLLSRCLDSAAAQSFSDFEHIIIDDGSSDGSEDTIRDYALRDDRIVYVRHDQNSGLPGVRTNEGVIRARGAAVAFLFDDNIFDTDFLKTAWQCLNESAVDVVHSNVKMLVKEGKPFHLGGWPLTLELMRNLNTIPNGGVLCKRSFFDTYGLYDPTLAMRRVCDWDLWLKALALGAKFKHLDVTSSVEYGLVSENSIGNTIAWDVKVVYGYMLDNRTFADRAKAFTPARIGDVDVLDPGALHPYVRSAEEWNAFVSQVYDPFFAKTGYPAKDFSRPSNRVLLGGAANSALDAAHPRSRVLIVCNSINGWAASVIDMLRAVDGQIVLNCPEWQMAAFPASDIDVLVLLDTAAQFIVPQIEAYRTAGVSIVYIAEHGAQSAPESGLPPRAFNTSTHIVDVLGSEMYFPQTGIGYNEANLAGARQHAQHAHIVCAQEEMAARLGVLDRAVDLHTSAASIHEAYGTQSPTVAYDTDTQICPETIARPDATRLGVRRSFEGLAALIASRPGEVIAVKSETLCSVPYLERIGIEYVARSVGSKLHIVDAQTPANDEGANDFAAHFCNIVSAARVNAALARMRHNMDTPIRVHIFLNSHMLSGSEVYGLMLARNLKRVGLPCVVYVPDQNIYGPDADRGRIDEWLAAHGLAPTQTAPYQPGPQFHQLEQAHKDEQINRLQRFLDAESPALVICSGYMPMFAALDTDAAIFTALFQASAYSPSQLAYLRRGLHGVMSDCEWSLNAIARLVGVPAHVVRSTIPVYDRDRHVMARPRSTAGIRIAIGGTLQSRKRQLEAIEAIALLRDKGYLLELNIYGYELDMVKDYLAKIEERICQLDLGHIVRRRGMQSMARIAGENDIILSASIDESLPQTLAQLMDMGLLAVAGLAGGIDEIVVDGETGFLTTDLSSEGLAEALERAFAAASRWPRIICQARALIAAKYSATKTTGVLLTLLNEGILLKELAPSKLQQVKGRSLLNFLRR